MNRISQNNTENLTWDPSIDPRRLGVEETYRNPNNQTNMNTSNLEVPSAPMMTSRQLVIEEPNHNQQIIVHHLHRNLNNELPIPDLFNQDISFEERLIIAQQNENFNRNLNLFFLELFERRSILENIQGNYYPSISQFKHPNNVTNFHNNQ